MLKRLGLETKAAARPLPRTVWIGGRKPGRQEVTLDRQALFDRVWSDPITTVAREWGISDQGLRKVCKKIQVPVPPRGYWARTRAGQRVSRPRLPELPTGQAEEIVVWVAE